MSTAETVEVQKGMKGGCQENLTNMQDGVTKWGSFPHAFLEGAESYHNPDNQ